MPPIGTSVSLGTFSLPTNQLSQGDVNFTSQFWGDFFVKVGVADSTSVLSDQQVVKVTVKARVPVITDTLPAFFVYNNNGAGIDLAQYLKSDSIDTAGVKPLLTFSASSTSCHVVGSMLFIDASTVAPNAACVITMQQNGNETYAPIVNRTRNIDIHKADQALTFTQPADMWFGNQPQTLATTITSSRRRRSRFSLPSTRQTPGCTLSGNTVVIQHAGQCTITASQPGNNNYNPSTPPSIQQSFTINKATQVVTFTTSAPTGAFFGDGPFTFAATHSTATPPSGTAAPTSPYPVTFVATRRLGHRLFARIAADRSPLWVPARARLQRAYRATRTTFAASNQQVFVIAPAPSLITRPVQFFTAFGGTSALSGNVTRVGMPSVFPVPPSPGTLSVDIRDAAGVVKTLSGVFSASNGAFTVTDAPTLLAPGSYVADFTYGGNANFAGSGPVSAAFARRGVRAYGQHVDRTGGAHRLRC
jgi:hypothetical protein